MVLSIARNNFYIFRSYLKNQESKSHENDDSGFVSLFKVELSWAGSRTGYRIESGQGQGQGIGWTAPTTEPVARVAGPSRLNTALAPAAPAMRGAARGVHDFRLPRPPAAALRAGGAACGWNFQALRAASDPPSRPPAYNMTRTVGPGSAGRPGAEAGTVTGMGSAAESFSPSFLVEHCSSRARVRG